MLYCLSSSRHIVPVVAVIQPSVGEWLSLVEHLVRDQGVGGSNPLSPTNSNRPIVSGTCKQTHPTLLNQSTDSWCKRLFATIIHSVRYTCLEMAPPNAWDDYRKRRNLALFTLIGYIPVVFVIALLSIRLFSTFTPAFVAAIAWMVFSVIAGNLALRFPCPRCGKWFFKKWWYYNSFARRCVHCGLPKYADSTAEKRQ